MNTTTLEILAPELALEAISATGAAVARRDELLTLARAGKYIRDMDSAGRAADILKEIAAFTRTIEETRKVVKAPIIDAGKRIDATAAMLCGELEVESKRIGGLVGAYHEEQKRREEEARRKAWEEQERIRREAEERERKMEEERTATRHLLNENRNALAKAADPLAPWSDNYADLDPSDFDQCLARLRVARKEREKAEADVAKAKSARAKAEAEQRAKEAVQRAEAEQAAAATLAAQQKAAREAQEAQAAMQRQEQDAAQATKAIALATPTKKITGIATGSEIKFEVTDINALYEAHPMFVLLSPNNAAIKAALKQLPEGAALPGIRHWREAKTVVRI